MRSLGGVPLPLYQDAVANEMLFVLIDAEIRFLFVENQEQVDKVLELQEQLPQLQHLFYDDPRVLTVSLHGDPREHFPFFAGYAHETGAGPGEGYNLNVPLPTGMHWLRLVGNDRQSTKPFVIMR